MIATVLFFAAAWVGFSTIEFAVLAAIIALVVAAELFNTAVETLTDLLHPHRGPLAALVKDVSAAAVLTVSVLAVAVGGCVFLPHLSAFSPAILRGLAVSLALVCGAAWLAGVVRGGRTSG